VLLLLEPPLTTKKSDAASVKKLEPEVESGPAVADVVEMAEMTTPVRPLTKRSWA